MSASASALANCRGFSNLESLDLTGNTVEREGLEALALSTTMPKLQELSLCGNPLRTGEREYHELREESNGVSGYYDVRIPSEEIRALFAHRPGVRVST